MDKQVLRFESHRALFCADDGLELTIDMIEFAKYYLKKQGRLYLELDPQRIAALENRIKSIEDIESITVFTDFCSKNRFVKLIYK